jgi:hypothetical protein
VKPLIGQHHNSTVFTTTDSPDAFPDDNKTVAPSNDTNKSNDRPNTDTMIKYNKRGIEPFRS